MFELGQFKSTFFAFALLAVWMPPTYAVNCWDYSALSANNPQPWNTTSGQPGCPSTVNPNPGLLQNIGQEHRNWHCNNPIAATDAYGRAFLAFHRQFILDFDSWRDNSGIYDRLEIWDPFANAAVPGNDETTSSEFSHCSTMANVRPAGALCTTCDNLPAQFIGDNLSNFSTLGEVGHSLEFDWHGSYHNGVAPLGCDDISGFLYTSRDPAFWMAHKKLDEVARNWQSRQATDVVLVIDRSGSMDDNCSSTSPPPSESPCAINDAREAARTFANLVLDERLDGGLPAAEQHRIGLVAFSGASSVEMGLTSAANIVTDNMVDDTLLEAALSGISTGGATSIAAGIRAAITMLSTVADPNPHQAIVVLTDGKENTPPCLEGADAPCVSGDVLTDAEVGDIQIVAVGMGAGAEETHLRDVAERAGGIFVAQSDVDDAISLQKFFVTAFGQIFDEPLAIDPERFFPAGSTVSDSFEIPICGTDGVLTVVAGWDNMGRENQCEMEVELTTPSGRKIVRGFDEIESNGGERHDFVRVQLPNAGEHKGVWSARLLRPDGQRCDRQKYFYSVLVKGLGKVQPWVSRPRLVPGRKILATFRLPETERPQGGFDSVNGIVTLTRPGGGTTTAKLFDDGSNGDKLAGNNIWSAELDAPADEPGIYHLHGRFELGHKGCAVMREAEYSLIAEPQPEQCTTVVAGGGPLGSHLRRKLLPGEVLPIDRIACVFNRCSGERRYQVEIADSEGWLKTVEPRTGGLAPLPSSIETQAVPGFSGICFGRQRQDSTLGSIPIVAEAPKSAVAGDLSDVVVRVTVPDQQQELFVKTVLEVAKPPDCNQNGQDDAVDIASGRSKDGNGNEVPDECDLSSFVSAGADRDRDGVPDIGDNCVLVANADQRDSDADRYGNVCDADLNNDLIVNHLDLAILKRRFLTDDADADIDGNGVVDSRDVGLVKQLLQKRPGPSGWNRPK